MIEHKTSTEESANSTWAATCSCGWTSPESWATRSDAECATGEHLAEVLER